MTTVPDAATAAVPKDAALPDTAPDHRRSPVPTLGMITTRFKELRKRRGLIITLTLVTVGIPTLYLAVRLLLHAVAPEDVRSGRRLQHLHGVRFRRAVRLRLHRGRHPGRHGRIRRSDRRDVPAPGGDRPLALGDLSCSDPRWTCHYRPSDCGGLHHRVCGVRVRRPDPAQLQRGERAGQPVPWRPRKLGGRPSGRGHLQFRHLHRTIVAARVRQSPRRSTPSRAATAPAVP